MFRDVSNLRARFALAGDKRTNGSTYRSTLALLTILGLLGSWPLSLVLAAGLTASLSARGSRLTAMLGC